MKNNNVCMLIESPILKNFDSKIAAFQAKEVLSGEH